MRNLLCFVVVFITIFSAHFSYAQAIPSPCDAKVCGAGTDCVNEEVKVCVCEDPKPGDTEDPACDCSGTSIEARCVQRECDSNADCGEAAVCIVYEDDGCGGGRPMVECPTTNPDCDNFETTPSCSPTSTQYCVPQYLASCLGNIDCGPGFLCVDNPNSEAGQCDLEPTDCMEDSECEGGNSCLQQQCGSGWCNDMFTDASYCVPPGFPDWYGQLGERVDPIERKRKRLFGCSAVRPNNFGAFLIFAFLCFYQRRRRF